jgi:peptidoglycan/LPS O-acetylase OafA/YrhL
MQVWGIAIAELATVAVLIALQRPSSQLALMFSRPALVWVGKMSYGFYLWHFPLFIWMRGRYASDTILVVGSALSVAMAALSYYTIEAWTGRWRRARLSAPVAS